MDLAQLKAQYKLANKEDAATLSFTRNSEDKGMTFQTKKEGTGITEAAIDIITDTLALDSTDYADLIGSMNDADYSLNGNHPCR